MEMSSVLCFCVWQQAAKEQRVKSITNRSRQARFLVRLRHSSEYSLKVIELSNRFSFYRITFILVYHSQWINACVLSIWISYTSMCINIHVHVYISRWEIEKKNLFLQATDTIFLSNEITNWNYWRITIKNEIWTCVLICLTIFSFRDRINNGYRSMVIWSLDWTKKKLLRVNIRSKIRSNDEKKKNLHIWHLRWDRKAKTDAINRRACGSIYLH